MAATKSQQAHAVAASFLGWTLDAFDFFVITFLYDTLATQFHVSKEAIIETVFWTLLMRPIGALIFGLLADRYGRRRPLMANVIFFSAMELLCGFAPSYRTFLLLRTLFGIGMGGEWGIGTSLAMETVSSKWRGILSGIVQNGYAMGYILAALAYRFAFPVWGWRPMFWLGGLPALLALYVRMKVPESEAWKQHRAPFMNAVFDAVAKQWKLCLYLLLLMSFMMFLSHGTQDLYPDFLKTAHAAGTILTSNIVILGNIGAIVGGIIFGSFSQRIGRRKSLVTALALSLRGDSAVGFRRHHRQASHRRISDASRRARRLGNYSSSPKRAFRGLDTRPHPRVGISTRHRDCRANRSF